MLRLVAWLAVVFYTLAGLLVLREATGLGIFMVGTGAAWLCVDRLRRRPVQT